MTENEVAKWRGQKKKKKREKYLCLSDYFRIKEKKNFKIPITWSITKLL